MNNIGKFHIVSKEEFIEDSMKYVHDKFCEAYHIVHDDAEVFAEMVERAYERVEIPVRKTRGSAGYDFKATFDMVLQPGDTMMFPTGLRVEILDEGWCLLIIPRSSTGNKGMWLMNVVGLIDSDYFYSDNEGHFFVGIKNTSNAEMVIAAGDRIAQGVFFPLGYADEEEVTAVRNGGHGSTGK